MPKRAKNIWEQVYDFENLLAAFRKCCDDGKGFDAPALLFYANLEENLIDIQNRLIWKTWQPGPWSTFVIHEPKRRVINAPCFADRVLHEALCRVIEPYFDRRFIQDSFACRVGKGTHNASKRLMAMLREAQAKSHGNKVYFLKADIASYFPSVKHDILWELVRRTIADPDVLWLLHAIIFDGGFEGSGLPIGARTSQLLANVYLDALDHHIKDDLGVHWYCRYMDDFIIIGHNKAELHVLKAQIGNWLGRKLELRLNPKTTVAPVSHGIYFTGYRHWTTHILPRKQNVKRAKRNFRRLSRLFALGEITFANIRSVVDSFRGYMQHCNGHKTCCMAISNNLILSRG